MCPRDREKLIIDIPIKTSVNKTHKLCTKNIEGWKM